MENQTSQKYALFQKVRKTMETGGKERRFAFCGIKFLCLREVFFLEGHDGFAANLPVLDNCSLLEIGSGTGCVSAAYYMLHPDSVKRVLATDINPAAVRNTQMNFTDFQVPGEVIESDLFVDVVDDEKFDVVFWNVPFFWVERGESLSLLDHAIADQEYQTIERYIAEADSHITARGRVLLGFSSDCGDLAKLENLANKHGKYINLYWKDSNIGIDGITFTYEMFEVKATGQ